MDLKRAKIDGKIMDVVSYETFAKHPDVYQNTNVAIEVSVGGKDYVMPYRTVTDDRPGLYSVGNAFDIIRKPEDDNVEYSPENIIDFSNAQDIKDVINKQSRLRDLEAEILSSPDDIFRPVIRQNDSPEIVALKEAVTKKNCDINKYAPRFGANFANDKRIFKDTKTTLFKMVRICNKMDIEAELILRDKSPDVPNPIGEEIHMILTGIGSQDDD